MANYSRGWAGTITQPASSWTNPAGATVSDDDRAAGTIAANSDSDWLVATAFAFQRSVPSGATVVGVTIFIEGFYSVTEDAFAQPQLVVLEDARLVIGGTIQTGGPAAGLGRPLGRGTTPERYELMAGAESDPWGQTPTQAQAAASNFGVALKFRALNAQHNARVDSIRMIIWWEKDPACVITSISPTTGGQAPFQYVAHANNSTWDDSLPQEVTFKWEVEGPEGWSQTVEDPRRGGWEDATRDLAVLWGKCPQWLFDVPGEYTVNCTMYRTLSDGTFETTAATPVTVTVDSSTRPKRYISSSGNDTNNGLSLGTAWKTLRKASLAAPTTGAEVIVFDDETITESTLPTFNGFTNLWIHRSGGGTNRPTITHSASISLSEFISCTNTMVQGLRFEYDSGVGGSRPWAVKGYNNTRWCIADCEHEGCDSFCEFTSSGLQEGILLLRCDCTDHSRYVLFTSGDYARYAAVIGGRWQTDRPESNEGHFRVSNAFAHADRGLGTFMAFVHTSSAESDTYSCCRHGWAEQDVYANRFDSHSTFNLSHYVSTGQHSWEFNSRYEANDMDYGEAMPWGERSQCVLFASNYVRAAEEQSIADPGVSYSYRLYLNTLVMSVDAGFWRTRAPNAGGTLHDGFDHMVAGNLWITELVPGTTANTTWTAKYWRNNEASRSMGVTFAFNVYNDDGSGAGTFTRWTELNTNYSISGWNGLSIASNELFVSGLHGGVGGTLPLPADSWALDPTAFSATRQVPPSAIKGVFFDYRLVERDPSVLSGVWPAGCTGDEP